MSLFRTENRRSLSNQKKSRTKPGNFRIKTKNPEFNKTSPKAQLEAVLLQEYMTDPSYNYALNSKGILSEMTTVNNQTAKVDVLVNQMGGGSNQPQFKLDPTLLKRLNSYGANLNGYTGNELTNFLQVRSVSLSNQDTFKKWKNMAAKQIAGEEKTQNNSTDKKKKLPSIVEQDSQTMDERTKMVSSFEIKSHREADTSLNYGVPKASSKEEKFRHDDSGPGSLPNVNERQNNSASAREKRRRWGSESPSQEKNLGPLNESLTRKAPKRKSSLTPKREENNPSKLESMGVGRFGPLEKIKEIGVKKSTNTKINTQAKNNTSTNSTTNNSLSNRIKPIQVNLTASSVKSNTQPTIDSNPKSVLNSKINLPTSVSTKANSEDKQNADQSPSKTDFTIDQISLHKNNSSKYSNDSSRNENVDSTVNKNGNFNIKVLANNPSTSNKKPQPQASLQQNKAVRGYNPIASFGFPQQASNSGSTSILPPLINQSQVLPQIPAVTSFMSNGSAINLRPAYAGIKVIEEPKKKVVYVPPPQSNKYKFYVGGGNNSNLVKRVLAKRDWWEETEFFNTLFSLKWQQTYRGYKYDRLSDKQGPRQLLNHFENHTEISTKNGLVKNLSTYCEANKINLFDLTPVTFCFDMDDEAHFDKDMQAFAKFFIKNNPDQNKYPHPNPNDKKNHNVWYNFDYRKKGSYHAPTQSSDGKKKSPYLKPIMGSTFLKDSNAWVLKPVGLNRGRGIEVFNSLETLNELMNDSFQPTANKKKTKKEDGTTSGGEEEEEDLLKKELNCKSRTFVVQKYIEDVLLINKRKFDIRVWVLVTHDMQLYFFKEGYLRTSSEEFSLNGNEVFNKFIHLTNNAVQKFSDKYGQNESGNQLSFDDFAEYMHQHGMAGDFRGKILPRMKELVKHSMSSVGKLLNPHDRKHCFEIFGYDFMIDAEFNVWLIEVNTNPCIEESSPLLAMLIPRMIDDAFKMTVDKIFPRNIGKQNSNISKAVNSEDKKTTSTALQNQSTPQKTDIITNEDFTAPVKEGGSESVEEKSVEDKIEVPSDQPSTENTTQIEVNDKTSEEKEISKPEKPIEAPKLASPAPQQAKPEEIIFSVKGYSDTESMWEHLCSLPVPRSPVKRDTKFNR